MDKIEFDYTAKGALLDLAVLRSWHHLIYFQGFAIVDHSSILFFVQLKVQRSSLPSRSVKKIKL